MTANNDLLADIFDVEPAKLEPVQESDNYEFAKKNLRELVEKGNIALDELLQVVRTTGHPRAFEVFSQLLSSVSHTNRELMNVEKVKTEIGLISGSAPKSITHNNLFVGSTKELQQILAAKKDGKEE